MRWNFSEMLNLFTYRDKNKLLLDGTWGLERETQRIVSTGEIALTDHPKAFGDKLDHPNITTDFAESQLELITHPYKSVEETYTALKELYIEAEKALKDEFLWPMSMPPKLPSEDDIRIAKFNDSEEGRKREIYRKGLALRYGKKMQMISGIHYNFSFGEEMLEYLYYQLGQNKNKREFIDELYFSTARNFLKYRWLLIYLFGASPNFDASYESVVNKKLKMLCSQTSKTPEEMRKHLKNAMSLRVSPFGYGNAIQKQYPIRYNTLSEYAQDVRKLLTTKSAEFAKYGIYEDDQQVQLNDNILQSEAELYSFIRFKQIIKKDETQLEALQKRGINYIEVRILDINPFDKVGISMNQLYFMHVFMLYCLFEDNQFLNYEDMEKADKNHDLIALYGRNNSIALRHDQGQDVTLKDWCDEIFEKLGMVASYLDQVNNNKVYKNIIEEEYKKVIDSSLTLASRICDEMKKHNETYLEYGVRKAHIKSIRE